ncbi:NAD(P)/FAD-dependent oxidoreductase [Shewanella sp. 10N.286.52.A9]|uniref:NAD(P)/FAD-dependent oxidoreductase n=1 Tax=Shewanella sp. 10N.286.52.A9 TaxID=3229711 RepID=UPI0035522DDE
MTIQLTDNAIQTLTQNDTCVIIGASHGGVNLAFSLRKQGWQGNIILIDSDPNLPYHRPPLSKAFLLNHNVNECASHKNHLEPSSIQLKSPDSYRKQNISLKLGLTVTEINRNAKQVTLSNGSKQAYDKLVLATGARPFIPPISGLKACKEAFCLRTVSDVSRIKQALATSEQKRVVIIGGGYVGLETASSLKKLGATVTVLEREPRILARVTAPLMSEFFTQLHQENQVEVLTDKLVQQISTSNLNNDKNMPLAHKITCADGSSYIADVIVIGVGITVNTELAKACGIKLASDMPNEQPNHNEANGRDKPKSTPKSGIWVNASLQTSDENIFAIGDCTYHHNPHYDRMIRLESVQNAVEQAKVAAKVIAQNQKDHYSTAHSMRIEATLNEIEKLTYQAIPWFWSDQFDTKLQMVGLAQGYDEIIKQVEENKPTSFSVWYFKGDTLLAVDAINHAKAYVLATKIIQNKSNVNKAKLQDSLLTTKVEQLTLN